MTSHDDPAALAGSHANDYRIVTYRARDGARAGVVVGEAVYDAAILLDDADLSSTNAILANWPAHHRRIRERLQHVDPRGQARLDAVALDAPLRPAAIYCAGANYSDHASSMADVLGIAPEPAAATMDPWFFLKTPHTVTGPGTTIAAPSAQLDWEGELAAVIGRTARNVMPTRALDHVAGYTVANDLSARDRIRRRGAQADSPFFYDFVSHKVFDGSCPLGPWIVPADAVGDPQALRLRTQVNGTVRQDANTASMTYPLAALIAFLSSRLTLHPGDLILTGTPAGVGSESGLRLKHGDVVSVTIERIGTLTNHIR